jgi:hypothetical protein
METNKTNSDSTLPAETKIGRTPPPNVIVPPGKIYMTVGDMPKSFTHGVLMKAFADYSVAIGRRINDKISWLGSGVLVRKGNHFGILTAHHCLHACSPEIQLGSHGGDKMCFLVSPGRSIFVQPEELLEHELAIPKADEFGPDLTFIEILSPERLGTFKAVGTFWSLDKQSSEVLKEFGQPFTPAATVGFPEADYNTIREGNKIRIQLRHMIYDNAIKEGAVFEKDGWDYLDSTIWYPGDAELPTSFAGVSGGPVWGMELKHHKIDGHISIEKHALIGITFYQIFRKGDEGRLRAHFIKSIYDTAWKNFG